MTDGDALLLAVVRNPEDDTPRLIYADWLQENGQPERAEFTRIQCELARLSQDDPRWESLRRKERLLLATHRNAWLGVYRRLVSRAGELTFSRGFVDLAELNDPTIKGEKTLLDVADSPSSLWLTSLNVWSNVLTDRGVRALAASPYLQQLHTLHAGGNWSPTHAPQATLSAVGIAALASSPFLAGLTTLTLSGHGLDDAAAKAIAETRFLTQLTDLDLRTNAIGEEGIDALAASPQLSRLTKLGLSENPGGPPVQYFDDWGGTVADYEMDQEAAARLEAHFGNRLTIY